MISKEFKMLHSETIMFCQAIEHDLKIIYSFMLKGDPDETFESLSKTTLGALVKKLKELDNTDDNQFISNDDYNFLKQMTEKRNYWSHQCYVDLIYDDDSSNYERILNKLKRDHDRFEVVSDNVERARLRAVETYKR